MSGGTDTAHLLMAPQFCVKCLSNTKLTMLAISMMHIQIFRGRKLSLLLQDTWALPH
jgi:hypothetical protein